MLREKTKVLVIEDNPDDFFLLKETLESSEDLDSIVFHADRLEKAINIAEGDAVDIAILDLNLPDSYGLDTFLNFTERFPETPKIIMTGTKDSQMALEAVQQGAQDYLHKGQYTPTGLARTIRHAVERQRLVTELKNAKDSLKKSLDDSKRRENELQAFLNGARAVLEQVDFATTARKVFNICSEAIGATSGYVALLSDDGEENEVLFLEAGGLPCSVDPNLPMPIRGLREVAYKKNSTVYDNDFMNSKWVKYMPKGHVKLENVMFAPLVVESKTIGIMGLANKDADFTEDDAKIATGFGELAAIALQNNRNLDKRDIAEKRNRKLIEELQEALANVKQLRGMLPICAHCKKIRDDKGYWAQLEAYLLKHSDAQFSHSICPECAKELYPDLDIYDEE